MLVKSLFRTESTSTVRTRFNTRFLRKKGTPAAAFTNVLTARIHLWKNGVVNGGIPLSLLLLFMLCFVPDLKVGRWDF